MIATNTNKEKTKNNNRLSWHDAQTRIKVSKANKPNRTERPQWNTED